MKNLILLILTQKLRKFLELDWVKELLKNESWNKKAEKLINLLFNSGGIN